MLKHRESQPSMPSTNGRRSFSHNIRSSLDNASSRFSFSSKSAQPSRRSISGPRSISSLGSRNDDGAVFDVDPAVTRVFSTYSMDQSEGATSPINVMRDESLMSLQPDALANHLRRMETGSSIDRNSEVDVRPGSVLSMRDDSCSSFNSTSTKWYKRFNRNSSVQRLSKAVETSELAFNASASRLGNPFSRRRSVPVVPKAQTSILGQTTAVSIEIGGHASNASQTIPSEHFPFDALEVPYIVDACISWLIENHAHMTPGIFRVSGSTQAVKTIIQHFSAGSVRMPLEHIELPGKQMISVHDVASCLKKYLVLLPDGLLGRDAFECISKAVESESTPHTTREIAAALIAIEDKWKLNINLVLLAFLNYISRQTSILSAEDDPKQESGFMTAFSLGIVFSPCCLGSTNGPVEMRRSSTSYSDRSVQSEVTPIEEAVANARRGAKVMQILIERWPELAQHLAEHNADLLGQEDNVSLLNIRPQSAAAESSQHQGLKTIIDSPIKHRDQSQNAHARTESVDTVVMHRRNMTAEDTTFLQDARIELLHAQILQIEKERDDAIHNLQLQQLENAKLFSHNLELQRTINMLSIAND